MEGEPTISAQAKISVGILNIKILEANYQSKHKITKNLEGDDNLEYDNKWRTYPKRITQLEKQRGQAFINIWDQCMQVIVDNMKHDLDLDNPSRSYNPLTLLKLIEKAVLA